jgi:hypothetical protein
MTAGRRLAIVLDEDEAARSQGQGSNAWWLYCTEVLGHVRLDCTVTTSADLEARLDELKLVIFPSPPRLTRPAQTSLTNWISAGGAVVTCGGPGVLADALGVSAQEQVAEGRVELTADRFWSQRPDVPIRAFGGVRLGVSQIVNARTLARWCDTSDAAPAVVAVTFGSGLAVIFGPDPWQSIVRIQQGWPVVEPHEPAVDGSAPHSDGILRCDDGLALSYLEDRAFPPGEEAFREPFVHEQPPTQAAPMFHRAQADLWRSIILQTIFEAAGAIDCVLGWLDYWPSGASAIAHMSHDSDLNSDAHADLALAAFDQAGVRVTWCHCHPGGYSDRIVAAIADAGHEQALHYNAMADTPLDIWGLAQLREQYEWASALVADRIVANKNHYTRWEGWTEFFDWCERVGVQIDSSRGPSRQGNVGFPWGSSHVWFPMADHAEGNRIYDVLELPMHTQDVSFFSHPSTRDVILNQAQAMHGVAHFLFHGANLALKADLADVVAQTADAARSRDMKWWTAAEINAWERARRGVSLSVETQDRGWVIRISATADLAEAAILLAVPGRAVEREYAAATAAGLPLRTDRVQRHGRDFLAVAVDIRPGQEAVFVRPT